MTMNKYILGIVVLAACIGGIWYLTARDDASPANNAANVSSSANALSGTGSMRALLALGRDLECRFAYTPEDGSTVDGTVYLAGERMRGNFTIMFDGEAMESHVIRDGEMGYVWGSTPVGDVAMKFTLTAEMEAEAEDAAREPFDLDEDVSYECEEWNVDATVFVPPPDVEFTDTTEMLQQLQGASGSVEDLQCQACGQIPDANAQAQCKAALGCN